MSQDDDVRNWTFGGDPNETRSNLVVSRLSWQLVVTCVFLSPIILIGIIGNLLSLLVWIKGRRRKTSTARYLSALAIADIFVLSITALEFWVNNVFRLDPRTTSSAVCKLLFFSSYAGPAISAWILVAVTMERALSVWIPHRINLACNSSTAIVATVSLTLVLCLIYSYLLVTVDVYVNMTTSTPVTEWKECGLLSKYASYGTALSYLDLCLFFVVPFVSMTICNILILVKVMGLEDRRQNKLQARGGQGQGEKNKMLKTVTKRIVILSTVFCVCNAPLAIFNILLLTKDVDSYIPEKEVPSYRLAFHILMYLNNGINFFLYCMIGSGFRRDLTGLFRSSSRTSTTR